LKYIGNKENWPATQYQLNKIELNLSWKDFKGNEHKEKMTIGDYDGYGQNHQDDGIDYNEL